MTPASPSPSPSQEMLLKCHLKTLRLPTMLAEYSKLAREAAQADEDYAQYLLRLTEIEVAQRQSNALAARIKAASFPVLKDLDTYDFYAMPSVPKAKIVELTRGQWIDEKYNLCFLGNAGTGKTHLAMALGQAACRAGQTRAVLHCRGLGQRFGGGPEAVPPGAIPRTARQSWTRC